MSEKREEYFMHEALRLAQQAAQQGEIPVGAVIVYEDKIIGRGYNQTVTLNDPTAHAEMIAITAATHAIGSRYLSECTLYATLEPCVMCAGACYWAMLKKVVYGAGDEKNGCTKVGVSLFHPKTQVVNGLLAEEASMLLKDFFKKLRK
ncbi:nucleoside deaminase [Thermoflexibacter ruber]|uniref:tRNA-specific adenosine deaminase n=1 Tax=Thermoflexibacter ruber TaxID=1003 RepID=A0A1I2GHL4_9BACT|nr:nucleoside deaminase [Thermoflexibacter ruber]SFF16347.1 tRNA(adenine34) deaminase [Thermoflexibacter ruber]